MGLSAILFLAHGHFVVGRKHAGRLQYMIFHYITAAICFVACIAYFTMASNLGYAAIQVEFQRNDPVVRGLYREIFYVRYIDWVITTPVSIFVDLVLLLANRLLASSPRCSLDRRSSMAHHPDHRSRRRNHDRHWARWCPRYFAIQMGLLCLRDGLPILHLIPGFLRRTKTRQWYQRQKQHRHRQVIHVSRWLDNGLVVPLSNCLGPL